jgi:hypothetical protein
VPGDVELKEEPDVRPVDTVASISDGVPRDGGVRDSKLSVLGAARCSSISAHWSHAM